MPDTMTAEEYRQRQSKGHKYRAKRVQIDGVNFASMAEGARYLELKQLYDAGALHDLRLQPRYPIHINGKKLCTYVADFEYRDAITNEISTEDVKGQRLPLYVLKAKAFALEYGREVVEISARDVDTSGMEQYVVEPHAARPAGAEGQG